jgi:uncharacterized protein (TIGR03382 family)
VPGTYAATVTVTDDAGTESANVAEVVVEILDEIEPPVGGGNGVGNNRVGALAPAALLLLGLAGLARRRRR